MTEFKPIDVKWARDGDDRAYQLCPECGHRLAIVEVHDDGVLLRCTFVHADNVVGHDWMPLGACGWLCWRAPIVREGEQRPTAVLFTGRRVDVQARTSNVYS